MMIFISCDGELSNTDVFNFDPLPGKNNCLRSILTTDDGASALSLFWFLKKQ
jgi:hypothetical protein